MGNYPGIKVWCNHTQEDALHYFKCGLHTCTYTVVHVHVGYMCAHCTL